MQEYKYRKAQVLFKDMWAGLLEEYEKGFRFTYNEDFKKKGIPISVSLPLIDSPFENNELFSFFVGLLPEGWYLDIVSASLKIDKNDRFGLLLSTCKDTTGAVSIEEIE
ncbi:MAG: HipA N-terminal domain-containing protein [Candidatus Aminicenantes bacterium]|nr:HipA N-terminal domain-containing protein [Candidatus Aminicenantes bacterium]